MFGKKFELKTDHKSLKYFYSKTSKPSAPIERWVLHLQSYDFDVVYKPGSTSIADALSRLNKNEHINTTEQEIYDFVLEIAVHSTSLALTTREIEKAFAIDPEFDEIRRYIATGDWASCKSGVANLSPTMRQLFIMRFQMHHNLHKSWRKYEYFPPMSRLFTKTKICSRL